MNTDTNTQMSYKREHESQGVERICAHRIEWFLDGKDLQLSDTDEEHIQNCLIENCVEGELCTTTPDGEEVWGWWKIGKI